MKIYASKKEGSSGRMVAVDDMILTKDMPTAAGSKMLEGYMSLFEAEVVTRLNNAGFTIGGKAEVGEFAIDLVGETSHQGACVVDGRLASAAAEIVKAGEALAVVGLDVNGSVRRAAAQNALVSVKPTYGAVSRYGTIPVACSGETVSVLAASVETCQEVLGVIVGYDAKDGTSLSETSYAHLKNDAEVLAVRRVARLTSMEKNVGDAVRDQLDAFCRSLTADGVEICEVENDVIPVSQAAWNILMCAELCNNVSRYDGVKYGYRSQNFTNITELYTNSRTEAFGDLLKTAILFGSETLSTENYMQVYDKALRIRRVVSMAFASLLKQFDAVLMPTCSVPAYTEDMVRENPYLAFKENFYTAPASITGLPTVVAGGVQLIGRSFSENKLLATVKRLEKEGK